MKKFLLNVILFLNVILLPNFAFCTENTNDSNSVIKYFLIGVGIIFIVFILYIAYKLDNTMSNVPAKKIKNKKVQKK